MQLRSRSWSSLFPTLLSSELELTACSFKSTGVFIENVGGGDQGADADADFKVGPRNSYKIVWKPTSSG